MRLKEPSAVSVASLAYAVQPSREGDLYLTFCGPTCRDRYLKHHPDARPISAVANVAKVCRQCRAALK